MRARVISVGERMPGWVAEGLAEYQKRLSRELPLDLVELKLGDRGKGRDLVRALEDEGAAMLAAIPKGAHVVALDGRGKTWSSEELAVQLGQWRMQGRDPVFLIGGPDGLAAAALARADQRFSLGALTLPHMLVRLILAEQLYRAVSLLGNHPYHRA
ncbi:23S rRNA (pseudouridine(1915)-N(3))-methyltransferase RlmH [Tahibacter amnicola]|uniref:Ribosomal RNA large subunit methyltransferase H n=1 Tax=Tahibacter amnicola TaxID=2976241 RepID=A0ABY6BIT0_9GAMM|nr:23S rRNA (pseudouridine(1915)-N(3))-methyltransferase RlmH [Tahibacter amnicola]UXI69921.1 23S rRNA (pseudouridine(1915)-N(3))-methyltransferase RlmH [Tahibacter amnicola]